MWDPNFGLEQQLRACLVVFQLKINIFFLFTKIRACEDAL